MGSRKTQLLMQWNDSPVHLRLAERWLITGPATFRKEMDHSDLNLQKQIIVTKG